MFSEDIHLCDWKTSVNGRDAAINETAKNLGSAGTIEIEPIGIYTEDDTVVAELKIVVDRSTELSVVDVVSFDSAGKIRAIRAYLGGSGE